MAAVIALSYVTVSCAGRRLPTMKPAPILTATLASATLFAVALTSCMSDASRPPATAAPLPPQSDASWAAFQTTVRPFLAQNCYKCHGEKTQENDLRLDLFADAATLAKNHSALEDALDRLTHQEMPPSTEARPAAEQQAKVVAWLEGYLASAQSGPRDPGRVTLRRLNRAEYNNTVRDLLGIDVKLADAFPVDLAGYGFDNNGDVLSVAPVLLEKYLAAARLALAPVLHAEPAKPAQIVLKISDMRGDVQTVHLACATVRCVHFFSATFASIASRVIV